MPNVTEMFERSIYQQRRHALRQRMKSGLVLLPGNLDAPMNFAHNCYPFRQDATFRYFFGLNLPGLIGVIDIESGRDMLFADDPDFDAQLWHGQLPSSAHLAQASGCRGYGQLSDVSHLIRQASGRGRPLHFLPPYRGESTLLLSRLTGLVPDLLSRWASRALIRAVVAMREIKEEGELREIESALRVSNQMHLLAMQKTRSGVVEREVVAQMRQLLETCGLQEAYPPIFTRSGQILHRMAHDARLCEGDLVINDAGASSAKGYASDVTRTLPVSGRFDAHQRELYELLLSAQDAAIKAIRPGLPFTEIHRLTAMILAEGMRDLGFFQGSPGDIVESGAYALCFPHGVGHLLGLDVHDMEALGEDLVGYGGHAPRSSQFGMNHLRLGKSLKRGMVLTVEPGLYFIPALIERWQAEGRHRGLIRYSAFLEYQDFGGMRIEDVVQVCGDTGKVLGPPILKDPDAIEAAMH